MTAVGAVCRVDNAMTRAAEYREILAGAVMCYAPRHDVVHIHPHAVRCFAAAASTGSAFRSQGSSSLGLPLRPVDEVIGRSDSFRDSGTGATAFDMALHADATIGAESGRMFRGAPARHAGRLIFWQHQLAASNTRWLRCSRALPAQFVRAIPAPDCFSIARSNLALGADLDRSSPLFRCARRAPLSTAFNSRAAVYAPLDRMSLVRDLTGLAPRCVARDRYRAVSTETCRHRTNMIPYRGCR